MAWVNFREVADRFSHIDGELVSTTVAMTRDESAVDVVLRFYPWWEHPLYVAARDQGKPWGITAASSVGRRDVRVKAIIARDFQLDVPEFEHRPEWFQP